MRNSKLIRNILATAASFVVAFGVYAQPANDDCTGATSFGSLNTPGACIAGLQNGTTTTLAGQSTVGATGLNPYTYLTACSGGGDMTSPALDTWYSFVATGTTINVSIAGFPNASVGLWEGPCANLTGRGCMNVNGSGNGTFSVTQATIGTTYYIQVSGGTSTAVDNNFSLTVDNDIDCDDCLRASTLTSTPNPVNGAYTPGQVVTFCYTVTEWSQENTNWFHGVQIAFGAGWTGAITNTVPAATCDGGLGQWGYYPAGIAGMPGPGFYFDGDLFNAPNGDPTTNYGDNCQGTGLGWTFCFDLTVAACSPGADLGVTINTTADGETGSWSSLGCVDDDPTLSSAYMICCDPPLTTTTPTTCAGDSDGALTAIGQGGAPGPYDYVWVDAGGTVLLTDLANAGISSLNGLAAGTYTVTVTDALGCVQVVDITVVDGPPCPPCLITSFSASVGACLGDNTFIVTGDFQYDNNPGTGVVTVTVTNGSGSYTQTFNPPFANNTTFNYSIASIPADGTPLTVTVVFSDDAACTALINSTSPPDCACDADIGTFTTATTGTQVGNDFVLCWGQTIDITANGDWTPPSEANAPPGPPYTPGIGYLVYSCPPTIALIPNAITDLTDDPCLEFILPGPNLNEWNDQWYLNQTILNGGSLPTNQTLYFVPVTLYSTTVSPLIYSYVNTTIPCYDLGPIYSVQYLDDITETSIEDCAAGTVTTTVTGGQPALDGSLFTGQNLVPATASFATGTAVSGGDIVVAGLVDGDVYSYDIVDANGCLITISGTFVGLEDPAFTYPASDYCIDAANPTPVITGDPGGTFSSTPGISLNSVTGQINLAASTPATYTVTYTTPDLVCFASATFDVTINPLPIVDGNDETICAGGSVTLNGTGANTYTWDLGVLDGVAFTPAATTTYTVTGTNTTTGCVNSGTATVTVTPLDDASFTTTDFCFGAAGSIPVVSGLAGGSFALNPNPGAPVSINPATGVISGGLSGATYTVEYTTNGACPQSSTQSVTVNPLPNVLANDVSVCVGGSVNITASGATTYSWDNGLGAGQTQNVSPAVTTNYTVTGTDGNGCVNTDVITVTVMASAPINAGPDVTICQGDNTTLTASGGVTYTWQAPIGAVGASQVVSPASTATYTVDGVDAAGCTGTDQVTVTIAPLPTATLAGDVSLCIGDPAATITFTGANGTAPYTFTYTLNGGAAQTVTSVGATATVTQTTGAAGTYSYDLVSVSDGSATACSQVQIGNATVVVNPLPTATIAGDATICLGDPASTITFTGANGTAPYTFTYTINGGANQTVTSVGTTATFTIASGTAGTFSYDLVSVQDASATACSQAQIGNATVIVNPLPTATIAGTVDLCIGDPAGTITFTGANGTAPYTFTYTLNGGPASTITSVGATATISVPTGAAGTFSYDLVSVQDASTTGCSQVQVGNATVVVNPLPTATIAGDATLCIGDPAATITFTGANGTAPYTFTYTLNGGANQTLISLGTTATVTVATGAAGTFSYDLVSVQDASSTTCSQAQIGNATVVVNPLPTATIAGTVALCEGDPAATITFTGANGTAPYTFSYNLNGGTTQTITSVGTTATITVPSTPVGTYNYNLESIQDASATGCSQVQVGTATVTVNPNPVPVINGAATYCTGNFSTLSTSAPFATYLWSTGDATPTTNVTIADNPITVTVTNGFGCSGTSVIFTVVENNVITYNTNVTICQGQSATIHGNLETIAGVYSQTFILGTGCDSTSNVTLVVNPLPVIDAGVNQTLCFGDPITLNALGAPAIVWDVPGVTNGTPFSQPVGTVTYTATGTDANGCVNTGQVDVTVNPLPTATIAGTVTLCQNDADPTITFTGANGTAPYTFTYNVNGGANQTVTSIGATATVTAPTGTVGTFNYNLISVQDASSTACSQAQVDLATVIINPLPTAIIAGDATVCLGDPLPTITFTGANGTAPYTFTYTINGGANTTVTSVGATATITVPTGTAGTFSYDLVSVQDASATACSQVQVGNGTVVVNPLPTATIAGDITLCVNDVAPTITFTGANGSAPYTFTYTINGGASSTVTSVGVTATVTAPTGTAGAFMYDLVSVQDASATGCSQAQVGSATIIVNPLPTATIVGDISLCLGEPDPTITFTGANGTAPYTFTYNVDGGPNVTITSVGTTATVASPAGVAGTFVYTLVSVQDASATGCSQAQAGTATVIVTPLPIATIAGTVILCVNDPSPTITFTGANGTAPYTFTYNINGGANTTVTSVGTIATVTVPTGVDGIFDYNLISVSDASATGCSQAQVGQATVTINPLPTATIAGTASVCEGGLDQTITFTGANGTAPYTYGYTINGGAPQTIVSVGSTVTITVSAAAAGTFSYELIGVQDASSSGCYQAQAGTAIVTINPLPIVDAGTDFTICDGAQAILTGSGALVYAWTGGIIDGQAFTPTGTDTYTVTGTDANGCVATDDITVTVEPLPVVSFIGDNLSGCASDPLTVTFTNTTPGVMADCIWTLGNGTVLTGCNTVTATFSTAGTYDVTLTTTSANGCISSETYVDYIYVEADPIASFIPSQSIISDLNPEVHFDNTSTGAVNYLWDFGDNSGSSLEVSPTHLFPEEEAGSYLIELVAYSPLGCTDTAWATIQLNEEVIYYVPNTFTPDDDDYNPTFQPVFTSGYDPFDFTLIIFNRWGEIIFESHNADIGWDGTYGGNLVQDGTYTWKIEFKTTANDERKVIHGHVNILR